MHLDTAGRMVRLNAFCARYHWAIALAALIAIVVVLLALMNNTTSQPDPALQGCPSIPDAAVGYDC